MARRRSDSKTILETAAVLLFALDLWATKSVAFAGGPLVFEMLLVDAGASGDDKAVADLDLDGDADGILAGSTLAWYRSNGMARTFSGPFTIRVAAVEFTTDMEAGDMDGDGDIDLVAADGNGAGNVRWYENPRIDPPAGGTSDPTVAANWLEHPVGAHGSWAHDVELGFVDGDAALDVVTLGNGFFKIHFADPGGAFTTVDFAAHADDGSPAIADVDGDRDGRVDLVTCPQHAGGDLAWMKNPSDPQSANWPGTAPSPTSIVAWSRKQQVRLRPLVEKTHRRLGSAGRSLAALRLRVAGRRGDLADPAHPAEVSRLTIRERFRPHWTGWNPAAGRIVATPGSDEDDEESGHSPAGRVPRPARKARSPRSVSRR